MNRTLTDGYNFLDAKECPAPSQSSPDDGALRLDFGRTYQKLQARSLTTWWGRFEPLDLAHVHVQSRSALRVELLGPSFELMASQLVENGSTRLNLHAMRAGVHYIRVRNPGGDQEAFLMHVTLLRQTRQELVRTSLLGGLGGMLALVGLVRS
jgi:hypothetical protein